MINFSAAAIAVPKRVAAGRLRVMLWVGLGVQAFPLEAQADPDSRASARRHYALAVELAREDSYAEALAEFRRAHALSPHFSVFYNIGQASIALDRPVEAVDALNRYLEEGVD